MKNNRNEINDVTPETIDNINLTNNLDKILKSIPFIFVGFLVVYCGFKTYENKQREPKLLEAMAKMRQDVSSSTFRLEELLSNPEIKKFQYDGVISKNEFIIPSFKKKDCINSKEMHSFQATGGFNGLIKDKRILVQNTQLYLREKGFILGNQLKLSSGIVHNSISIYCNDGTRGSDFTLEYNNGVTTATLVEHKDKITTTIHLENKVTENYQTITSKNNYMGEMNKFQTNRINTFEGRHLISEFLEISPAVVDFVKMRKE